jgi:hypothetical protein
VAFAANERGRLGPADATYGVLNGIGAIMLALAAVATGLWGFLVLETAWAIVSFASLHRLIRERRGGHDRVNETVGSSQSSRTNT